MADRIERRYRGDAALAMHVDIGVNRMRTLGSGPATEFMRSQNVTSAIIARVVSNVPAQRRRTIWERCAHEEGLRAALGLSPLRS